MDQVRGASWLTAPIRGKPRGGHGSPFKHLTGEHFSFKKFRIHGTSSLCILIDKMGLIQYLRLTIFSLLRAVKRCSVLAIIQLPVLKACQLYPQTEPIEGQRILVC